MRDHAKQAARALSVYLERGLDAERLLRESRLDEALDSLRRRTAAFHNFRVQDELARRSGHDIARDPEMRETFLAIQALDARLEQAMRAARERTLEEAMKLKTTRRALDGYRSTADHEGGLRIEQSV